MSDLTRRGFFGSLLLSLPLFKMKLIDKDSVLTTKTINGNQVVIEQTQNNNKVIRYYKFDPNVKDYLVDGILHRENGPAFIIIGKKHTTEAWIKNGKLQMQWDQF